MSSDIKKSFSSFLNSQSSALAAMSTNKGTIPLAPIGVELETLAEKILFNCNAMVTGRFSEVYGPARSCKSAFVFDRYRYMLENGGGYIHLDNEDKDAPSLRVALMRYPEDHNDADWVRRSDTMGEWMGHAHDAVKWLKKICGDEPKSSKKGTTLGRAIPFIIGVDSLMSCLTEDTVAAIRDNNGSPTIGYPREANILTQWFKFFIKEIANWPISVWVVNHGKLQINTMHGIEKFYAPGGAAQNFHMSYRFLFRHVQDIKRNDTGVEGQTIKIKNDKNSFGVTNAVVEVDMLWKYEEDPITGERKQLAWWDWDSATTFACDDAATSRPGHVVGERGRKIKEILGLRKEARGMWSCSTLDVSPSDPVDAATMGKMINTNKELMKALEEAFEIKQIPVMVPGQDIRDTIEEWKKTYGEPAREQAVQAPTTIS